MQSFWKARKRSCGFVFFGALPFFIQPCLAKNSNTPRDSTISSVAGLPSQVVTDSLEFLNAEGRVKDFEALQNKIIPTGDLSLIEKVIEVHLANKNRQSLHSFVRAVAEYFRCRLPSGRSDVCGPISKLWKDNLDSVYFYEESPAKILRAKRMQEGGECGPALSLLQEVELKEGFPRPLVDTARAIAECLGNKDMILLNEKRADELRVFE